MNGPVCNRCCQVPATRECTARQVGYRRVCEACFASLGEEQYLYVPPDGRSISSPAAERLPATGNLKAVGSWRVYFNRHGAAPLVWCVSPADGSFEIAVSMVTTGPEVTTATIYRPKETPDADDGKPSAWIAVDGLLIVHAGGHATIGEP